MSSSKLDLDYIINVCKDEVIRGSLVSHPKKFKFAETRGMKSLDEVHEWMVNARRNFVMMVEAMEKNNEHV